MSPALWGMLTALGWGGADFIARFTARAAGYQAALLAMLGVGAVLLSLAAWLLDFPMVWDPRGWWALLVTGLGAMFATLLLYRALARGPVSVAAAIVGAYPAFNVALALVLGTRPTVVQWAAMLVAMAGVAAVALSARAVTPGNGGERRRLRGTVPLALASAFASAVTVAAAQYATPVYGEFQTVWMARWISLGACAVLVYARVRPVRIPHRTWPLIVLQGLLDAGAYLALLAGSRGAGSEITVVVASSFSAVTVLLARAVLREAVSPLQWAGVGGILAGVAVLSVQ